MSQYHPPSYARYQAQQPPVEASSSGSIPRNSLLLSSHSSILDEDDLSFSIAPRRTPSRPPQQSTSTSSYQHPTSSYYQQGQSQAWSMVLPTPLQPPPSCSTAPSASPSSLMPMPSHDGLGNFASPSGMGTTNSRSLWEEESFSGTETDLGGGGWSQVSISGGEDLDAASSSSGSSGGGRRRDYREKRTRGRAGSSSTMSISSSLLEGLDTEGLSEMSLSPPSLDVEVDDDPHRTSSMSRVPTLLALHQQPPSTLPISRPYHRPPQQPSGPPLQPHSQARTLIDSERFELLLSLSPSAISAGIRPLLLPPSSPPTLPTSSFIASSPLLGPFKSTCFVPPLLLSLLSLDMDSELLSLLHHNPSLNNSTQSPLWHALFLTPPSLDSSSSSPPSESLSLEGLFERVRRAGRTSLNFRRRLGEGEDALEEEEEEGFVLGRWKWREGWRGLVVGWTG